MPGAVLTEPCETYTLTTDDVQDIGHNFMSLY